MRPVRSLLIYGGIVFAGGALLAPWLYRGVQLVTTRVGSVPFHRCFDRSLLVLAVAGLWPLLRGLGVRSWKE